MNLQRLTLKEGSHLTQSNRQFMPPPAPRRVHPRCTIHKASIFFKSRCFHRFLVEYLDRGRPAPATTPRVVVRYANYADGASALEGYPKARLSFLVGGAPLHGFAQCDYPRRALTRVFDSHLSLPYKSSFVYVSDVAQPDASWRVEAVLPSRAGCERGAAAYPGVVCWVPRTLYGSLVPEHPALRFSLRAGLGYENGIRIWPSSIL